MRSPAQISSSTLSTGKLEDALLKAGLMRRKASSLPSLCGMVTMRGADTVGRLYLFQSAPSAKPITAAAASVPIGCSFIDFSTNGLKLRAASWAFSP
jgi:hypothetical protein